MKIMKFGRRTTISMIVTTLLYFTSCGNQSFITSDDAILASAGGQTSMATSAGIDFDESNESDELMQEARAIAAGLSLHEKIGQLLFIQFRYGDDGSPIRALDSADRELFESIKPGGVILFRENFYDTEQVIALVTELQELSAHGLFIAADEEGGLVSRIGRSGNIPSTDIPPAYTIGKTADPQAAFELYGVIARELKALGLNMNFAPVADVLSEPDNPVIATRAFSSDPIIAAEFVGEAVRGLQSNGVISVAKHFPGHGGSAEDSHFEVVSLPFDRVRLDEVELPPFVRAIEQEVAGIMTAHLYFPNVDGAELPASLSEYFLNRMLRNELGYDGLIITDALEMRGLRGLESSENAGILAVRNGADMLLIPPNPLAQRDALLMSLLYREVTHDQLMAAVTRVIYTKLKFGLWHTEALPELNSALAVLGSPEHKQILAESLIVKRSSGEER